MWSPNELLKIEKQRDILSYITLQFFHFKKVPLEHCPFKRPLLFAEEDSPVLELPEQIMVDLVVFLRKNIKNDQEPGRGI